MYFSLHLTLFLTYVLAESLSGESEPIGAVKTILYEENIDILFKSFKHNYGKTYTNAREETRRKKIFKDNVATINQHNTLYLKGEKSFYLGINGFADLTLRELQAITSGSKTLQQVDGILKETPIDSIPLIYPDSVDWRQKGFLTPVREQGSCASDWAFSTAGALEGQVFKYFKKLLPLSAQQLMDCSGAYHNYGCSGGLPTNAYQYISAAGGIESETDYPYEAKENTCKFNKTLVKADVYGWGTVKSGDEKTLQQALAMFGPMSVLIDSSHTSFYFYRSGIYDEPNCSNTTWCHAVLTVGYNTNPDYWIVKNSWGTSWGEDGYIRMSRNKNNQCGIANNATFPYI